MKKMIMLFLSMLLSVMMISSLAFAEEAAEVPQDAAEGVEEATTEAEETTSEELSLEDLLGESEGISVEVPLSEAGEMTMESYETLEVLSNQVSVEDYEIDSLIDNILAGYSSEETITEGTVEDGDSIVIDFSGVLEGEEEPFEGGSAAGVRVTLGSGTFIPGFEEQIAGHAIGETFDIEVTFPEDYTEELAGKNATFTITIQNKIVPHIQELNDEFVQSFSAERLDESLNTVDDLKEYVRNYLYESYLQNAIINQLLDKVTVITYPEQMFQTMKDYSMNALTNSVYMYAMQGMGNYTEDMIAQIYGYASAEDYTNDEAKNYLNTIMMADQVAEDLGLEVTDEELNEYLANVMSSEGMDETSTVDELKEVYGDGWLIINKYNLLLSKVLKELENRAVIVESGMTYQDFMLAEIGAEVKTDLYVQDTQSWKDGHISVYAADPDGGYFVYNMECSEEDAARLTPGTKIHVEGHKAEWTGEIGISDAVFSFAEDGDTFISEPVNVTNLLGKGELVNFINQRVTFEGLTVAASTDADGNEAAFLYQSDGSGTEGDDLYFKVSLNDETYSFMIESDLCQSDSEVYQTVQNLQIGDVINAEGFLFWYEGPNPHIYSITVQ